MQIGALRLSGERRFDVFLDARGLACPIPLVKTRQALMVVERGASICVLSTDPASKEDFERFCEASGHRLLSFEQKDDVFVFVLEKS